MTTGKIRKLVDERGFGFIKPAELNGKDIFFHISGLVAEYCWEDVRIGDRVQFETEMTDKGLRAVKVRKTEPSDPPA